MKRVVTFGEIMMRLNPPGYLRFAQTNSFDVTYAGAEASVAVSLANYGVDASFVTKLPGNPLGQSAVNEVRRYGAQTENIVRGGPRVGIYFIEKGASQRPSSVCYDRANSSIALAARDDFDWNEIFDEDTEWFHFTGITPALGGELPAICTDACKAAKARGITISCDLNYRKNLWTREQARSVMEPLMEYVDLCIANEEDASDVFGIVAAGTDIYRGKLDRDGYSSVARQLKEQFSLKQVAITLRGSLSASDNEWSGLLFDGDSYFAPNYKVHIIDRVGGGDSFCGGLIYALLMKYNQQKAIDFAVAASCLKHSIEHDFNMMSVAEVEALASGDASGRVRR